MAIWQFDPTHTTAAFNARHMMITNVRGQFQNVTGTLSYDAANPAASTVEAKIEVKSMASTGVVQRDQHLLSPDFLDAEQFPVITFKSTKTEVNSNGLEGKVHGNLTIKNVTLPVTLTVEKIGENKNPWGQTVIGFSAHTKINREDFGLTWNMALEAGGWLVGKEIKIELDVEAALVVEPVTEAAAAN
ncbi:MAG: polyisoprenoid-binding protein [Chloroflexi bacterium]|nr:polyisoprenoid-binding protein [Chloroflexota bacterium]